MSFDAVLKSARTRPLLHGLCLVPFVALVYALFAGALGANPVEALTHETGQWTLRFLLFTLAVTPLRRWSGLPAVSRYRRMFGLYAFFYLCCHFLIWFVADHSLSLADMIEDIVKRPYITLGFSALMLMVPLAATSSRDMVRRLGRKWKSLHQVVYLVLVLGVLHFIWLTKADYIEPGIYAIVAIILLLHRVVPVRSARTATAPATR